MNDDTEIETGDGAEGEAFRCGYVGILGRPNAGKSTLLNALLGEKVSITSDKPQTTRNRVVGIYNAESVQAVLVDTPGWHEAWTELNRRMVQAAEGALADVDVVVLLVDVKPQADRIEAGREPLVPQDLMLIERVAGSGLPVVLGLNKMDQLDRAELALPVIQAWSEAVDCRAVVPFSALRADGVERLLAEVRPFLPEHPPLFPTDQLIDGSERFVVAEIIREKLFRNLSQELPYSTAVEIERFDEEQRDDMLRPMVRIFAKVLVERESQKAMVIGRGGATIKKIGSRARRDIERLLGCQVFLKLFVRVERDWTKNPRVLRELGYPEES